MSQALDALLLGYNSDLDLEGTSTVIQKEALASSGLWVLFMTG